jgi:amidase
MTRYAPPSPEELILAAERLGVALSADAAAMFARYGAALEFAYRRVDTLDEYLPTPDPRARTFTQPSAEENRFGAWLVKSSIKRGAGGKLAGKRRRTQLPSPACH